MEPDLKVLTDFEEFHTPIHSAADSADARRASSDQRLHHGKLQLRRRLAAEHVALST